MALIKCPECGRQISSNAAACPDCGNPIARAVSSGNTPHVTTEKTGKNLKAVGCLFVSLLLIGVCVAIAGGINNSTPVTIAGILMGCVGFIGYIVNRLQTWWQHG